MNREIAATCPPMLPTPPDKAEPTTAAPVPPCAVHPIIGADGKQIEMINNGDRGYRRSVVVGLPGPTTAQPLGDSPSRHNPPSEAVVRGRVELGSGHHRYGGRHEKEAQLEPLCQPLRSSHDALYTRLSVPTVTSRGGRDSGLSLYSTGRPRCPALEPCRPVGAGIPPRRHSPVIRGREQPIWSVYRNRTTVEPGRYRKVPIGNHPLRRWRHPTMRYMVIRPDRNRSKRPA